MKYLKTLGLAAMAVLALTAMVGVSSASAAEFHATNAGAIESAIVNQHKFNVTGAEVVCSTIAFNGNAVTASPTQVVAPSYSSCTAFGFVGAEVNTAGCKYEFSANSELVNLSGCTAGGINIHVSGCSSFVPNQNGINGITYASGTAPNRTIIVKTKSTNIKANVTEAGGFGCPLTAGGEHANATYNGETGVMVAKSAETWVQ